MIVPPDPYYTIHSTVCIPPGIRIGAQPPLAASSPCRCPNRIGQPAGIRADQPQDCICQFLTISAPRDRPNHGASMSDVKPNRRVQLENSTSLNHPIDCHFQRCPRELLWRVRSVCMSPRDCRPSDPFYLAQNTLYCSHSSPPG